MTEIITLETRAALHRALSDRHRLLLVDCLIDSDRTPGELVEMTGLSSNLLAFHLKSLEAAGLVQRHRSEGDARRRYVRLRHEILPALTLVGERRRARNIVFVCTQNSARSQFAEAVWQQAGGCEALSAGTSPAERVHPLAIDAARAFGVDLSGRHPKGFDTVPPQVDVVVSVCDRALESGLPPSELSLHWSVPDPVDGGLAAFSSAFTDIAARLDRLRSRIR
jgi:protein-tyrosine-phosphatase/DNA-binding MarR family transcriptional regulator